ncbi:arsenical pump-driving ATPase [Facklamia sp. DSM 111018]|uniref:Arsenical pump-driving ATPase n=1 Tax=Facklamia lactis TaxID=2749967 RepID=A0ABS0LRX7_9LACT|nr:arsenical pump-driving ATPase [Facklamia lactis]MBG9986920.1 arsenical pump-driving ATPase [Facklamia lactis]
MKLYHPDQMPLTPYLFYTGKGGVGKTTIASATAVQLANKGKRVILVSTDPASNLQDVFETELSNKARPIVKIPNLKVANFNPDQAVDDYKERVIGPYRDILPSEAIDNMEEQLSGSCTLEVAQFNEFAFFLSDPTVRAENDYIIFDTAPTGHTLRMLELPSAWTSYFDENTTGTSCMGQLSGLTEEQERYELALKVLNNPKMTTLFMVTRPQGAAIAEANRSLHELSEIGIQNHQLIINGLLENANDEVAETYRSLQIKALDNLSDRLQAIDHYYVPLRPYNVTGVNKLKIFLEVEQDQLPHHFADEIPEFPPFERLIDDLIEQKRQIIFTMGKGGVGKTSVAVEIAHALSDRGQNVRLATTDPADHLHLYLNETKGIKVEHIDEKEELRKYSEETLAKSREFMDEDQLDYVKEDLKSPCTQEIAVFKAFAKIVDQANENETIVIDTAPTGHTILLLDSSRAYSQEIERSSGDIDPATQKLLPRIQSDETEVVMVTLAEATPYYETHRLAQDLDRANINHHWWLINQSMLGTGTQDLILGARAYNELEWIKKIDQESNGNYVVLDWNPEFKSIN